MRTVDLRSDTATRPTPAMRKAMAEAEVGDDVLSEDPTVNRLQDMAAERVGKEAALFVTSGVQGNLLAIMTHLRPGDDVICDVQSHVNVNMTGGVAVIAGATTNPVHATPDGWFGPDAVEQAIKPNDSHLTRSRLVCIENTNNAASGTIWTPQQVAAISRVCRERGLGFHCDGARIFNSAVAQGVHVQELVEPCDSVMFCVSKGMGSPVGSLLAGPADFIAQARRSRKMLGGGMRQAGVLAACGIVSLTEMIDRLADDHRNARGLAEAMADMPGIELRLANVQTNIVRFSFTSDKAGEADFVAALASRGVLCFPGRMVTHNDVTAQDVDYAIGVMAEVTQSFA